MGVDGVDGGIRSATVALSASRALWMIVTPRVAVIMTAITIIVMVMTIVVAIMIVIGVSILHLYQLTDGGGPLVV